MEDEHTFGDHEYAQREASRALPAPAAAPGASGKARKRGSRGNGRRAKPYSALTWQEKLALEDADHRRGLADLASTEKLKRDARGRPTEAPAAPRHTTAELIGLLDEEHTRPAPRRAPRGDPRQQSAAAAAGSASAASAATLLPYVASSSAYRGGGNGEQQLGGGGSMGAHERDIGDDDLGGMDDRL